ncbi:MAG: VRR-NUC domain-containing protein [Candidatus Cloacimonetes bacterium]|nr:VRR-NUC domain-containing protein [Candidatus Cloacimonadota bacterium]
MKRKNRFKIKITENNVKKLVKDYLDIKGYFHFSILQGLGAYKGIPDRIAVKNGKTIYIEVKKPGGKQSEHQVEFQANIENAGGEYILVRCLEDLIEGIKEGGEKNNG